MRSRPEAWLLVWVVGCGDAGGGSEGTTSTGDASTGNSMPPLGGPPQDERTRLGEWLACGAPTAAEL